MTPAQEHLQNHLRRLTLHRMEQVLATVAEEATKAQLGYTDFLTQLLEAELDARYERTTLSRIRLAHVPFAKTLADFHFSFQPSIDQKQLKELAKLRFIDQGENVIFLGPPGVGKPRPFNYPYQYKRVIGADRHHHRPSTPALRPDLAAHRHHAEALSRTVLCGLAASRCGALCARLRDRARI
jgi:IstB-like ATP binding protein